MLDSHSGAGTGAGGIHGKDDLRAVRDDLLQLFLDAFGSISDIHRGLYILPDLLDILPAFFVAGVPGRCVRTFSVEKGGFDPFLRHDKRDPVQKCSGNAGLFLRIQLQIHLPVIL